jgi:uncharacterized protein YciI
MWVADPMDVPTDVFMYTLHPARSAMLTEGPTDSERALAAQHWAYSQDLLQRQIIIFGGRVSERVAESFAVCVIRAESEQQARGIMEADPAVEGGLFRARLFRFQPMLVGEWPPKL